MKKQLILLLTATLNLAACGENKPADSGEKAVTTQAKPAETTDERCQKDGENNAEQDGEDCVVVDSKKPDSPPNKPDELKGQALLQKYAPKACYKSVSLTTTVTAGGMSSTHKQYANLDLKAHMSITKAARGCVIKMWQYADRQGYMWFNAACSPANVPRDLNPCRLIRFFVSSFIAPKRLMFIAT